MTRPALNKRDEPNDPDTGRPPYHYRDRKPRPRIEKPRRISVSEELTALAELLDWVDLIDAPGTVLADLVQRSRIELDAARAAPQADEGRLLHSWGGHVNCDPATCTVAAMARNADPVPAGLDVERALALVYAEGYGKGAPVAVAKVCDETLDRSGALLGRIRERARALSQLPEDAP